MVYLTAVTVKGRRYWILAHSVRVGGKVRKRTQYLGTERPSEKELAELKEAFLRKVAAPLTAKKVGQLIARSTWVGETAPAALQYCLGFVHGYLGLSSVLGIRAHTVELLHIHQGLGVESSVAKERSGVFAHLQKKGPRYLSRLERNWLSQIAEQQAMEAQADALDGLSDEALLSFYKDYRRKDVAQWSFSIATESADTYAMQELLPRLREDLAKQGVSATTKELSEMIVWLTRWPEHSFLQRERISYLELCRMLAEEKRVTPTIRARADTHAQAFFWIANSYAAAKVLDADHFLSQARKEAKRPDIGRELAELSRLPEEILSRQQEIGEKYPLSPSMLDLIAILRMVGHISDVRKEMMLRSVGVLHKVLSSVSIHGGVPLEELLCYLPEEIEALLLAGKKVPAREIAQRKEGLFYAATEKGVALFSGTDARLLMGALARKAPALHDVRGFVASTGGMDSYTGRISVVRQPEKDDFRTGDILVTTMTRPDFVPLMRRASAIVTDEGGVTCHAAIVARELSIPCIVGTQAATKVFSSGDLLRMNLRHGLVERVR